MVLMCLLLCGLSGSESMAVPRIEFEPDLATLLSSENLGSFASVDTFTQREPHNNRPASQETKAFVAYDRHSLYVFFKAFDQPQQVRGHLAPREQIEDDDTVSVIIDTFYDQQRGYEFRANPRGIQWDALWSEGSGSDTSYQAVWHCEARRTSFGYAVLFTIPFKSLRFPRQEVQNWGIMLGRTIARKGESAYWPPYSIDQEGRLNQAATLTGISGISPGRNIDLVPYGFFRDFSVLEPSADGTSERDDDEQEWGGDAKFVIKDSFVLDLTLNPDFSQVESDQPLITANQRFEQFFSERRPFFLENADFFSTPTNLVFTRRIVDPSVGLKFTGKKSGNAVGVLLADDKAAGLVLPSDHPDRDKDANIGVMRFARDLPRQSRAGILATRRQFADQRQLVVAADARIKWTQNWVTNAQWAHSRTKENDSETTGESINVSLNRSGRHFTTHSHVLRTDPDFSPQLGFLGSQQRSDSQNIHHSMTYTFRPEGGALTQWGPTFFAREIWDTHDQWLEWTLQSGVDWTWYGHTEISFRHVQQGVYLRPEDQFQGIDGLDFQEGQTSIEFETRRSAWLQWQAQAAWGTAVHFFPAVDQQAQLADWKRGIVEMVVRPHSSLRFDLSVLYTQLDDRHGRGQILSQQIGRVRTNWQFSNAWSLRAILEHNDNDASALTRRQERENLNIDLLVRFLVNPWTAVYLGVNNNQSDRFDASFSSQVRNKRDALETDARQVFIKASYLFQP